MRLRQSDFFGESCLEGGAGQQGATRKAHVVALGDTTCLRLSAANFHELLGDLTETVADNLKRKVLEAVNIEGLALMAQLDLDDQDRLLRALEVHVSLACARTRPSTLDCGRIPAAISPPATHEPLTASRPGCVPVPPPTRQ